eukprot:3316941-Amphidinium_carterae.1
MAQPQHTTSRTAVPGATVTKLFATAKRVTANADETIAVVPCRHTLNHKRTNAPSHCRYGAVKKV